MQAANAITATSVIVAAASLLYAMRQQNVLKRREYADRIRHAASETTVALERWKTLCLRMYEDIQPLLTDADIELVETRQVIATRDHFWRSLVEMRSKTTERVTAEKIETAYVNLYGYNARIQQIFADVTTAIRDLDQNAYLFLLEDTQDNILRMRPEDGSYTSAELSNLLRRTCAKQASNLSRDLSAAIAPCAMWLLSIIEATDKEIAGRSVGFPAIEANQSPVPDLC